MSTQTPDPTEDLPLVATIKDSSVKVHAIQFTINVKTTLPQYTQKEYTVVRSHDDFEWLHSRLVDNPKFVGLLIPSCPPKPDFDVSRDSIANYTEDDDEDSPEYKKMREELEREYLAFFKKTVAAHELFMLRLSKNKQFRIDFYVMEFLTSDREIISDVGAFAKIKGLFNYVKKGVDDGVTYAFSNINEPDEYFETQMQIIQTFVNGIKEVAQHADAMTRAQKALASATIKLSIHYKNYSLVEYTPLYRIISSLANYYDGVRKIESRISSDEDLKLTDTLKFHLSNLEASRELLIRRIKCYVAQENSLKALNRAKSKNENVPIAEDHYQQCIKKCTDISESAKAEIETEKRERVIDLKKNLISYAELQILHMKALIQNTTDILEKITTEVYDNSR